MKELFSSILGFCEPRHECNLLCHDFASNKIARFGWELMNIQRRTLFLFLLHGEKQRGDNFTCHTNSEEFDSRSLSKHTSRHNKKWHNSAHFLIDFLKNFEVRLEG
jgi:hypothetical protein